MDGVVPRTSRPSSRFQLRWSRTTAYAVGGAVVLVALVIGIFAFSGGSSPKPSIVSSGPTTTVVVGKTTSLHIGPVYLQSAGPHVKLDAATRATVLAASQKYINTAIVAPLATGRLGSGYGALFDPGVRTTATGADVGALTDTAVGRVSRYDETTSPATLSALSDQSGQFLYVAMGFSVKVKAQTAAGALTIGRNVELTFAPAGAKSWLPTAYRVITTRATASATTTTTAGAGAGAGAGTTGSTP